MAKKEPSESIPIAKEVEKRSDVIKSAWINTPHIKNIVAKAVDKPLVISYIYRMKEKEVVITSSNITPKQWSSLLLELNLIVQAWKPYAKL